MKTSRLYLSILLLVLFTMTGCQKHIQFYEPPVTESIDIQRELKLFGFKYEAMNVQAIEEILHDYMDIHDGINISYEGIKGVEYYDLLMKRIKTNHGDDLFMIDQATRKQLEKSQMLADLSDLTTIDQFSELVKDQMLVGGKIDYVPTSISAFGLYCNEDMLQAHGQKIPQNLDEFLKVCDYFVQKGITPIIANNDISLKTIILAKGMYPVYQSKDRQKILERFNTGEENLIEYLRPGFELTQMMLQRGYLDPYRTLQTEKTKDDLVDFAKGENPFMLTGAWAAKRLTDLKPNFTFSIHPYPIMEDGSVLMINVDTRMSINAKSPYVKEAKAFLEYLTQKDVMWKFVDSQSSFSPLKDEHLSKDETVQSIGPYLNNGRSVLGTDDNLIYPVWNLVRDCVQDMLKGDTMEATISSLEDQLTRIREEGK